eukprot:TRINITY_DN23747_c0_g1_i1.p1 TRINITY_DN23747_c0_g1~~TRINITY_DN23747_c0_g1_i1.p1  ORF type:complete len:212 (-),score=32.79 TRINITY_DN23747_c0_g1_i1:90-725(-)
MRRFSFVRARPTIPISHWNDPNNERKFLDGIATEKGFNDAEDWKKLSQKEMIERGGRQLLKKYGFSLWKALQSVYPEKFMANAEATPTSWNYRDFRFERFPPNYWQNIKNQRQFMDELALKLDIKQPSDWGCVQQKTVNESYGSGLLSEYGNSLPRLLKGVYPEIDWNPAWFPTSALSSFKDSNADHRKFVTDLEKELGVKQKLERLDKSE